MVGRVTHRLIGLGLEQLPFPRNSAKKRLLALLKPNRLICKRTNTDVAFTREYSRVSISTWNAKCTNPNYFVWTKVDDEGRE
jgi:hypothetical protein